MRPFLGVDITNNRKNEKMNGEELIIARASQTELESLENFGSEQVDMILNKVKLPLPVRILSGICGIIALLGAMIAIITFVGRNEQDSIPVTVFTDYPWIFITAAICFVIWSVCTLIGRKKEKSITEGNEYKELVNKTDSIADGITKDFNIPDGATEVDIISMTYSEKDGKIKPRIRDFLFTPYMNYVMRIFRDDDTLYLADWEEKYAIPLSELRAIHTVNKRITLPMWNKDVEANKGEYKKYKIRVEKYGDIEVKPYHILEFFHGGTDWGIYFPCYELEVIEKITGLKADTDGKGADT